MATDTDRHVSNGQRWSPEDSFAAMLEGWDVWDSDGSGDGPFQIQFLAEPGLIPELGYVEPKFDSEDTNAWVHVREQAAAGSALHQRALLFIEHNNSLEYARIMRWPEHIEAPFAGFDPTDGYQDVFPCGRCDGCGLGLTADTTHDEDACNAKGPQRDYWE